SVASGLALENALYAVQPSDGIPQNVPTDQQSAIQNNPQGLGLNQVWLLYDDGTGELVVQSITSRLVWTQSHLNPFLDGLNQPVINPPNQKWIFQDLGHEGPYKITPVPNPGGQVLEMPDNAPGTLVQQLAPDQGGRNQQWWVDRF